MEISLKRTTQISDAYNISQSQRSVAPYPGFSFMILAKKGYSTYKNPRLL